MELSKEKIKIIQRVRQIQRSNRPTCKIQHKKIKHKNKKAGETKQEANNRKWWNKQTNKYHSNSPKNDETNKKYNSNKNPKILLKMTEQTNKYH